jgi:hypothetical protein
LPSLVLVLLSTGAGRHQMALVIDGERATSL